MLSEFRSTYITWDKATSRIYTPVTANESDSNGRKLNIQVVNSGQVENLTGATLHLYWETKDKAQHGLDAFTASDISKGEFEIFYTTGMLSNVGELNATLVLVDATGKVVSDWFKITVARGIDNDAIQSENSFTTLTQALIDISDLEQNYAPRLNDLTAQLQQTEQELNAHLAGYEQQLHDYGYQKIPNGLIFQWGTITHRASNSSEFLEEFSFPIPFTTNVFYVGGSVKTVTGSVFLSKLYATQASNTSLARGNVSGKRIDNNGTTGDVVLTWFAIGF